VKDGESVSHARCPLGVEAAADADATTPGELRHR
jgi:hypothetical protein